MTFLHRISFLINELLRKVNFTKVSLTLHIMKYKNRDNDIWKLLHRIMKEIQLKQVPTLIFLFHGKEIVFRENEEMNFKKQIHTGMYLLYCKVDEAL